MKDYIYTIFDKAGEISGTIFHQRNDISAIRFYRQSTMKMDPLTKADFKLVKLGEFDNETMIINTLELPEEILVPETNQPKE